MRRLNLLRERARTATPRRRSLCYNPQLSRADECDVPTKKRLSLGAMAAWAAIIAVPIGILTIPQANDYVFKTLLHVKSTPEPPKPEPIPLPAPTFTPPDLEGHKWTVNIRASGFPAFEGHDAVFLANHDYQFQGNFLVPTGATDQHIDCPSNVSGRW